MATVDYLPSLEQEGAARAGQHLQATLVELIDLSLLGKQLHWSVVGPHFRPLHEQLDELVDSWRELADGVAERAIAIGYSPDGQAAALAASSDIVGVECGALDDRLVVRVLSQRLADVSERVRRRMEALGELDLVSQDLLIGVLGSLEQQLWMVRAQLSSDDT